MSGRDDFNAMLFSPVPAQKDLCLKNHQQLSKCLMAIRAKKEPEAKKYLNMIEETNNKLASVNRSQGLRPVDHQVPTARLELLLRTCTSNEPPSVDGTEAMGTIKSMARLSGLSEIRPLASVAESNETTQRAIAELLDSTEGDKQDPTEGEKQDAMEWERQQSTEGAKQDSIEWEKQNSTEGEKLQQTALRSV